MTTLLIILAVCAAGSLGFLAAAFCAVARRADDVMENMESRE